MTGVVAGAPTNYRQYAQEFTTDNGWSVRYLAANVALNWQNIIYGGGTYVAVASNSANAQISSDGLVWTARALGGGSGWYTPAYNSSNGNLAILSTAGSGATTYSTNGGVTWTYGAALPSGPTSWYVLGAGNGLFVAADTASNNLATSPTGATWTARTSTNTSGTVAIAYGSGLYVAFSSGTTAAYSYSADATTWTAGTLSTSQSWLQGCLVYGGGMFIGLTNSTATYVYSTDGLTWNTGTLPISGPFAGVAYANGVWFAMTRTGTGARSSDGINWTTTTAAPTHGSPVYLGLAGNPNLTNFTAVTTSSGYLATTFGAATNTWTAPEGVTSVQVLLVGGGGGGGGNSTTSGGGGGGGGQVINKNITVVPGTTYAIILGSGGYGALTSTNAGSNGGNSTFGTLLTALGGGGGGNNTALGFNNVAFNGLSGGNGGGVASNTAAQGAGGGGGAGGTPSIPTTGSANGLGGAGTNGGSAGGAATTGTGLPSSGGIGLYGYGGGGGGGGASAVGVAPGANGGGRSGYHAQYGTGGGGGGGYTATAGQGYHGGSGYCLLTWYGPSI
jgi:hypothetical protein